MNSIISEKLKGKFNPIVLVRGDVKPENAIELVPPEKGNICMMELFAQVVAEGKTAVFQKTTCGCTGAKVAFGFGNAYLTSPMGPKNYAALFSKGLEVAEDKELYGKMAAHADELEKGKLLDGERLFDTAEKAYKWVKEEIPVFDFPQKYAILKPLTSLVEGETPQSVIFTVNPLELSGLIILSGTVTGGLQDMIAPFAAAACQTFGNFVFTQENEANPKPVLGLIDLSARPHIRPWISDDYLTYSMTWGMFLKMEEAARDGIFDGALWKYLKN